MVKESESTYDCVCVCVCVYVCEALSVGWCVWERDSARACTCEEYVCAYKCCMCMHVCWVVVCVCVCVVVIGFLVQV